MVARCQQRTRNENNRFTFQLEGVRAASIALVGSFNQWSTTQHLMRFVDGRWEADVTLPPGRHSYGFFAIEKAETPRGTVLQIGSTIDVPGRSHESDNAILTDDCLTTAELAD